MVFQIPLANPQDPLRYHQEPSGPPKTLEISASPFLPTPRGPDLARCWLDVPKTSRRRSRLRRVARKFILASVELLKASLRPPPNSSDEAKRFRLEPFHSEAVWWRSRAFPTARTRTRARTCLMRTCMCARSHPARVGPDAQSAHLAQSPLLASSGQTPNPQDPKMTTQDPPGSPQIRPRLHQASPRFLEDPPKTFQDPQDPAKPFPRVPRHPPKQPIITSRSLFFCCTAPSFPRTIYQE
jgi:hypothetical protein